MGSVRSCWLIFLVLTLVALHVTSREVPKSKNTENNQETTTPQEANNKDIFPKETTTTLVSNNPSSNAIDPSKDVPKGNEVSNNNPNNDEKTFLPGFGGMGAAGGVGGIAGVIPINFLDKSGLGMGFLPGGIGGGTGGAGGIGGGGGGCPCSTAVVTGGVAPIP